MKIIYLGNFGNPYSDSTEKHIKFAFEMLGHEVECFDETNFDMNALMKAKGDFFLFHKGGTSNGVELPVLVEILNKITIPKVFWYFDKIWNEREHWMHTVIPFVDHGFMTDETWMRRQNYKNISILRQGIGNEDTSKGQFQKRYFYDVAFCGSVYGSRSEFVQGLMETYQAGFRIFNNVFGRELYDLAASVKVLVAPKFPQDDYYWSSRVYMMLGSGGFLIHPRLEGLKEEFTSGEHLVMYTSGADMKEKIDYYLEHEDERKKIQEAGYKHCIENFTYKHRVESMLKKLYGEEASK